jgi:hypothetical protein
MGIKRAMAVLVLSVAALLTAASTAIAVTGITPHS